MNKRNSIIGLSILILFIFSVFGLRNYVSFIYFSYLYNSEKYNKITESFSLEASDAPMMHNLGNAYFRLYQQTQDIERLSESLFAYSGSLGLGENEDTRYNYDFVKNILDMQQKSRSDSTQSDSNTSGDSENQEESEQQEMQGENQSSESSESGDSSQDSQNQQSENTNNQSNSSQGHRGSQYSLDEGQEVSELTSEESMMLQQEIENLKNQQIYNQRYFGKQEQQTNFGNLFESFFGEINRGGEKDW